MPITVTCANGHKLKAKDELAGKTLKCPKCATPVAVPRPQPVASDVLSPIEEIPTLDPLASHNPLGDPLGSAASDPLGSFPANDWMSGIPMPTATPTMHPSTVKPKTTKKPATKPAQLLPFFGIGAGGGASMAVVILLIVGIVRLASSPSQADSTPTTETPSSGNPVNSTSLFSALASVTSHTDISFKLKRIGLAMHNYHDARRQFPVAAQKDHVNEDGTPKLSWRVHLLPYLDQKPLYDKFKLDEPWDSPNNKELIQHMPDVYRTGDDKTETRMHIFSGKGTIFDDEDGSEDSKPTIKSIRDGPSHTLLVVHAGADKKSVWTRPDNLKFDPDAPKAALGNLKGGDIQCVMAGGQVVRLPGDVDAAGFAAIITPNGREVVDVGTLATGGK